MLSFLARQIIRRYKPAIVAIVSDNSESDPSQAIATALSGHFAVSLVKGKIRTKEDAISGIFNPAGKNYFEGLFAALAALAGKRTKWPEVILLNIGGRYALENLEKFAEFLKFDFIIGLPSADKSLFLPENAKNFVKSNTRLIVKFSDKSAISAPLRKSAKIITYSSRGADIFSSDAALQSNGGIKGVARFGISFKINYKGSVLPVRIGQSVSEREICNILIASLVGLEMGMNLVDIASSFGKYRPVNGARVVEGIKNSAIIDNSEIYNPEVVFEALESLPKLKSRRKLIVLGDILRLGLGTEAKHREIGKRIFALGADLVFCVGERVDFTMDELRRSRFPAERIFKFDRADEVEKILQPKIREDDLILVIGSKEAGLEKVVRQIMANPMPTRLA